VGGLAVQAGKSPFRDAQDAQNRGVPVLVLLRREREGRRKSGLYCMLGGQIT